MSKLKYAVLDGSVGEPLEDLHLILKNGEFLSTVRLSAPQSMQPDFNEKEMIQKEVDKLVAILPPHTVVRSISKMSVVDLSLTFEVKLYNHLMADIKRVDVEYIRMATRVGKEVKEFKLLKEIKYFGNDWKPLWSEN